MISTNPAATLSERLRDFRRLWHSSGDHWHDATRQQFAAEHLDEILASIDGAVSALGQMQSIIQQANRSCQ